MTAIGTRGWAVFSAKLPPEMAQAVDDFTSMRGMDRSDALRTLLALGLEHSSRTDWTAVRAVEVNAQAKAMQILVGKVRRVIEELES